MGRHGKPLNISATDVGGLGPKLGSYPTAVQYHIMSGVNRGYLRVSSHGLNQALNPIRTAQIIRVLNCIELALELPEGPVQRRRFTLVILPKDANARISIQCSDLLYRSIRAAVVDYE